VRIRDHCVHHPRKHNQENNKCHDNTRYECQSGVVDGCDDLHNADQDANHQQSSASYALLIGLLVLWSIFALEQFLQALPCQENCTCIAAWENRNKGLSGGIVKRLTTARAAL